ncbi:hypothetical protein CR152_09420 [Massilia violaceinigra]|uniref:Uncharacterized protein n=1 Tax=Massilia violaceinigra TaxID=2045208 RepID=A0A2D2DIC0_9BURK|nr:hypothetical protein CR152_09420 [Massilia violaceinigra]
MVPVLVPVVPPLSVVLLPLDGMLADVSPPVPLVPLAVSPLMPVEVQAASPTASKPANSMLCSIRFMINSFGWVFSVGA